MFAPAKIRDQHGATLINLMVGVLISMIALLATLQGFKNVTLNASKSMDDASSYDQLLSSSLSASISLQEAGYGITSPALGAQIVLIPNATLISGKLSSVSLPNPPSLNAIVWQFIDADNIQKCAGFYAGLAGGLVRLPAIACTGDASAAWPALQWPTAVELVPQKSVNRSINGSRTNLTFNFKTETADCKPFGQTQTTGNVVVSISATSTDDANASNTVTTKQCLVNFQ